MPKKIRAATDDFNEDDFYDDTPKNPVIKEKTEQQTEKKKRRQPKTKNNKKRQLLVRIQDDILFELETTHHQLKREVRLETGKSLAMAEFIQAIVEIVNENKGSSFFNKIKKRAIKLKK